MSTQWYQDVHPTKHFRLGTIKKDTKANEYIYLKGATQNLLGAWNTYDSVFATTPLVANAVGPVAISMALNTSILNYSWYQISGINTIALADVVSSTPTPLYIDDTQGQVDDLGVSGDWISNAINAGASVSGVLTVQIDRPFVSNNGYLT